MKGWMGWRGAVVFMAPLVPSLFLSFCVSHDVLSRVHPPPSLAFSSLSFSLAPSTVCRDSLSLYLLNSIGGFFRFPVLREGHRFH